MSDPAPRDKDEHEDLVAYLDGELDEEAARAVEAKLSRDPRARAEAEALKLTWDLLDYLPRPEPSASFTHRTLERVAALRPTGPQPVRQATRRRWVRLAWVATWLLAAGIGFGAVAFWPASLWPVAPEDDIERLARDLRVIENVRLYQYADDIKFLRDLDHPDLFGDDLPGY
ncbi:MAG: hypothetical protein NZ700_12830 [Gemmataceae bacterium]|nr:hypothetical protein [Gemmataceae bacterium]MDW8263891.1 hypothetical protein [Gemmataceae bacterium]